MESVNFEKEKIRGLLQSAKELLSATETMGGVNLKNLIYNGRKKKKNKSKV